MNHTVYISSRLRGEKVESNVIAIIEKAVLYTLKSEKTSESEVSVSIVSKWKIQSLNKKYRGKNRPTDVLSFPMTDFDGEEDFAFEEEILLLGDVILCLDVIREHAEEYGVSYKSEIARMVIHSVLHLLGYDHENNVDMEQIMYKKQEKILKNFLKNEEIEAI